MRPPLKRLLAGCVALGLTAAPGLAKADDAAPPAPPSAKATTATAKPKARPVVKAKLVPRTAAAARNATPKAAGNALLLPQPEPMETGLAVARTAKSAAAKPVANKSTVANASAAPATAATQPVSLGAGLPAIPVPPSRPPELIALGRAGHPTATEDDLQTASIPVSGPLGVRVSAETLTPGPTTSVDALISRHAARYGLPESLLRRVVKRESGGNPHLRHGAFLGLMQMRLDTARGMGYSGSAEGLLDANTSLTYGAAYLANAWRVSGGNPDRAVSLYAGGYYYEAKRKGMLPKLIKGVPAK